MNLFPIEAMASPSEIIDSLLIFWFSTDLNSTINLPKLKKKYVYELFRPKDIGTINN